MSEIEGYITSLRKAAKEGSLVKIKLRGSILNGRKGAKFLKLMKSLDVCEALVLDDLRFNDKNTSLLLDYFQISAQHLRNLCVDKLKVGECEILAGIQNSYIQQLTLQNMQISETNAIYINHWLRNCAPFQLTLNEVTLHKNSFSLIWGGCENLVSLLYLEMEGMDLREVWKGSGFISLLQYPGCRLRTLSLNSSKISEADWCSFSGALTRNLSLEELYIIRTGMDKEGMKVFASALQENKTLMSLSYKGKYFNGTCAELVSSLGRMSLKKLDMPLSLAEFSGIKDALFESLRENSSLHEINVNTGIAQSDTNMIKSLIGKNWMLKDKAEVVERYIQGLKVDSPVKTNSVKISIFGAANVSTSEAIHLLAQQPPEIEATKPSAINFYLADVCSGMLPLRSTSVLEIASEEVLNSIDTEIELASNVEVSSEERLSAAFALSSCGLHTKTDYKTKVLNTRNRFQTMHNIWDFGNDAKFLPNGSMFYTGNHVVILVFDCARACENPDKVLNELMSFPIKSRGVASECQYILVGMNANTELLEQPELKTFEEKLMHQLLMYNLSWIKMDNQIAFYVTSADPELAMINIVQAIKYLSGSDAPTWAESTHPPFEMIFLKPKWISLLQQMIFDGLHFMTYEHFADESLKKGCTDTLEMLMALEASGRILWLHRPFLPQNSPQGSIVVLDPQKFLTMLDTLLPARDEINIEISATRRFTSNGFISDDLIKSRLPAENKELFDAIMELLEKDGRVSARVHIGEEERRMERRFVPKLLMDKKPLTVSLREDRHFYLSCADGTQKDFFRQILCSLVNSCSDNGSLITSNLSRNWGLLPNISKTHGVFIECCKSNLIKISLLDAVAAEPPLLLDFAQTVDAMFHGDLRRFAIVKLPIRREGEEILLDYEQVLEVKEKGMSYNSEGLAIESKDVRFLFDGSKSGTKTPTSDGGTYDIFLSHAWGSGPENLNHKKALEFDKEFTTLGYKVWLDERVLSGLIDVQMAEGIRNSCSLVVLLSMDYLERAENPNSNVAKEFRFGLKESGLERMIFLVVDKEVYGELLSSKTKYLTVSFHVSDKMLIDCTSTKNFKENLPTIRRRIAEATERLEKH